MRARRQVIEPGLPSSPMPDAPAPMLCTLIDAGFDSPDWTFEPKFDGLRVLDRLDRFLSDVPSGHQVAVEFRHPTWNVEETFSVLERHGAAYCVMSGANLPCMLRTTAAFVFVRLPGPDPQHMYAGSYSEDDLRWWADRIGEWKSQGRNVYAYFNNDGYGHAVRNALRLRELVDE